MNKHLKIVLDVYGTDEGELPEHLQNITTYDERGNFLQHRKYHEGEEIDFVLWTKVPHLIRDSRPAKDGLIYLSKKD